MAEKRSLYQCFNAKVHEDCIYCAKGHKLWHSSSNGTISIHRLGRGQPLELTVCQSCPDYDEMGEPVPANERGWYTRGKS